MPPDPLTVLARGKNAEVLAWGDNRVLKLFRPGYGRGAIVVEFRHATLAHRLGIPTPRAEEIIELHARTGIVFERVHGPTLYHLVATAAAPAERLAALLCEIQSAIHRCAGAGLPAIEARLASMIAQVQGVAESTRRQALDALHRLPGGDGLCHGDFHPANLVLTEGGPRVLDWLDAAHGPAAADAARTLLLLELARPAQVAPAVRAAFVDAYRERLAATGLLEALEPWRLPVTVARLAEPVDAAEREALHQRIALLVG